MADHPSMEGLREAAAMAIRGATTEPNCKRCDVRRPPYPCSDHRARAALDAQAAYLAEHGVLLSGKGLVPDTRDVFTRHDAAAREYIAARGEYESAIQGGDPDTRRQAQERFDAATQTYVETLAEVAAARKAAVPTFEALLADPTMQVDPDSLILASIAEYAAAKPASAGKPVVPVPPDGEL